MSRRDRVAGVERRISSSADDTRALGRELAARLSADATVLLTGDLGSGKTVLTQGLGEGLGLDRRAVQSPSYTLINEYRGGDRRLIHVDLYRVEAADLPELGLEELLAGPGIKVVEWAQRIDFPLPAAWRIELRAGEGPESRTIDVWPPGAERTNDVNNHGG